MANFVQQLNIEGSTYDLHDSEFIVDTRTASGAALTGVSKAPALFDGMQITFWLSYAAASNATLNLTLADGTTTGAIPCYYSGTTRLGTHYAAGNAVHFTYRENVTIGSTTVARGWWGDANYTVSDTNYDIFGTAMKVDTAVYNYSLFAITGHNGTIAKQTNTNEAGTYWKVNSFTQSAGNGTSKKATTKGYYPYKIFYNPNNTSYTTAGGNTSTVASGTSNLDLRYTVNGTTSANIGATGAPFFLVGTIGSDGLFYLKGSQATKEWWTAGVPTTKNTNYVYWFVGVMSSAYQVRLSDRNWFLKWTGTGDNDHLIQFEPWFTVEHANSADSVPWSGITSNPYPTDVPSGDGDYSLNVSNGTTSWTTAGSGGPNTPDAPASDGNYVLNVDSGSSSWQEAPEEALIVEFDTLISDGFFPSAQATFSLTDLQAAVGSGRPVYLHINIPNVATINPLIVCSAETHNQYFCCSVIFAQGTPDLSGGNLERPSYGTFLVESVDETHIKVNLYLLMAGLQDTWVASPNTQTNVIPEKIVNISNGLLSISDSTDSYAVKSPSGLGGQFLYYVLD